MSDDIRIIGVEVSNFARLKVAQVTLDPEAGLIRVTGPNRAGKTSLLRAIQAGLGGASAVPDKPIHDGADPKDGSWTKLTLSNGFAIERRFTPATSNGYLTVVSPDGGKYGQGKLDEWVGPYSFAPLAFYQIRDKKKAREVLLSLAEDPDLEAKLADLDERRAEFYSERTTYIVQKRDGNKIPKPEGERPEPVDVGADMARLDELEKAQRTTEDVRRTLEQEEKDYRQIIEGIAQLEARLVRAREMQAEKEANIAAMNEILDTATDHAPEITALRNRMQDANAVTATLERWRRYEVAQEALAQATEREAELTALIAEVDAEKAHLLAESGIPVEGLTFDAESGEPMLNGVSFDGWSGAERIHVAVSLALAANPKLRVCLVDEANDMDLDSLKALDALAKEKGFHIWACRIGLEGKGEVVVEDGEARSVAPVSS